MTVPVQAFKEASKGNISEQELHSLGDFAEMLKEGAVYTPGVGYGSHGSNMAQMAKDLGSGAGGLAMGAGRAAGSAITSPLGQGLTLMGASAGAAIATPMIAHGMRAVHNKLTYKRDLNNLLDVRPEIRDEHNERDINLAFQSMRTLNPQFAKDPLTGSTLLTQILRNRDIHDPDAPPRMDLGVARELFTAERRGRDEIVENANRAFDVGVRMGIEGHRAGAQARKDHAQSELSAAKMDLDANKFQHDKTKTLADARRKGRDLAQKRQDSAARGLEANRSFKQREDQFASKQRFEGAQKALDRANKLEVALEQANYREAPAPYNPPSGTPDAQMVREHLGLRRGGLKPQPTGVVIRRGKGLKSVQQRLKGKTP